MAINYNPLNRNSSWSTDQKNVLRKVFGLAETAAAPSTSATISRTVLNRALGGKLPANQEQDIRSLFAGLRDAIDADDTAYDLSDHFAADSWTGNERRIIRAMAQSVVDMISAV
jgi:hypothetical protein